MWYVSYTLVLKREDKTALTPGFDYATPINSGRFTFGADAEIAGRGLRTLTTKQTFPLQSLDSYNCTPPSSAASPLLGDLGLKQSLADALDSYDGTVAVT